MAEVRPIGIACAAQVVSLPMLLVMASVPTTPVNVPVKLGFDPPVIVPSTVPEVRTTVCPIAGGVPPSITSAVVLVECAVKLAATVLVAATMHVAVVVEDELLHAVPEPVGVPLNFVQPSVSTHHVLVFNGPQAYKLLLIAARPYDHACTGVETKQSNPRMLAIRVT